MIHQVQKELPIEFSCSLLIGYKDSDLQAGVAAGVGTNNLLFAADSPTKLDGLSYELIATLPEAMSYLQGRGAE